MIAKVVAPTASSPDPLPPVAAPVPSLDGVRPQFLVLSAALTGFSSVELELTGTVDLYLAWLASTFADVLDQLMAAADTLPAALADPRIGPLLRSLTGLWYTATWSDGNPPQPRRIFAEGYPVALVWRTADIHPQGARPTGFASWAEPPAPV